MEEYDLPHHLHVAQSNKRKVRQRYRPLLLAVATTVSAVLGMGLMQILQSRIDPSMIAASALGGFIVTYLLATLSQNRKNAE